MCSSDFWHWLLQNIPQVFRIINLPPSLQAVRMNISFGRNFITRLGWCQESSLQENNVPMTSCDLRSVFPWFPHILFIHGNPAISFPTAFFHCSTVQELLEAMYLQGLKKSRTRPHLNQVILDLEHWLTRLSQSDT